MPKEIHSYKPISIPEVREILKSRKKDAEELGEELSYIQSVALDHAVIVSRTSSDEAIKTVKKLVKEFKISEMGAIALVNYLPGSVHSVRVLLDTEGKNKETSELEQILEVLNGVKRINAREIEKKEEEEKELVEEPLDEPSEEKELPDVIPEDLL